MKWWKLLRWTFLYPLLSAASCHFLITGSPVPLWYIQRLDSPIAVKFMTDSQLVLEDGREIGLPFIKKLPSQSPLFQSALADGIEVRTTGDVFGLMWIDPFCGNDPYVCRKLRVNLSDLAGALYPSGIDDTLVHPDAIAFAQEHYRIDELSTSRTQKKQHLSTFENIRLRQIRRTFDPSMGY